MTAGVAEWGDRLLAEWAGPWQIRSDDADDAPADPVADWADSGVAALTGRPDGPPVTPPGSGATAARGAEAAFRALSGSITDPIGWHRLLGERAALTGGSRRAPSSVGGSCRAAATADGWVAVNLARPDDIAAVAALTSTSQAAVDQADGEVAQAWRRLDEWAAGQRSDDVAARARLLGLPAGVVPVQAPVPGRPICRVEVAAAPAPDDRSPIVVDLSALWAGPLCAHLLAGAGARVVKVETAQRLDGARYGNAAFYDLLHAGADSVVVDLDRAADRELLDRLLVRADIVVTASRPRAWTSLHIDPYDVCRRSATTWVAITAYGLSQGDRVGFGDDVAMGAGLVVRETPDGRPVPCGDAIADPLTGMHAAVAALASYRTGGSRLLDVSMYGVVAATVADGQPAVTARRSDGGWLVDTMRGPRPVQSPAARRPRGAAAPPGRDTERWRDS